MNADCAQERIKVWLVDLGRFESSGNAEGAGLSKHETAPKRVGTESWRLETATDRVGTQRLWRYFNSLGDELEE